MVFHIRDDRAVRRLAARRKPSITDAVRLAAGNALERSEDEDAALMERIRGRLRAMSIVVAPLVEGHAVAALTAHGRFAKGRHAARPTMGDGSADAVAAEAALPILFKGDDFSQTDLPAALPVS